jgi:hypothetical protein
MTSRLADVKETILVMSGKGGVGKKKQQMKSKQQKKP